MSRSSQPLSSQPAGSRGAADGFLACTFPMSASTRFDWHAHDEHQLAWTPVGTLSVLAEGTTWLLPPARALWIPAGLPHETRANGRALMRSVYLPPARSPVSWDRADRRHGQPAAGRGDHLPVRRAGRPTGAPGPRRCSPTC